jgi:hypothetical protein
MQAGDKIFCSHYIFLCINYAWQYNLKVVEKLCWFYNTNLYIMHTTDHVMWYYEFSILTIEHH